MGKNTGGGTSTKKGKTLIKKLGENNKAVITQKVIIHKELKYIYPKGCKDTVARKAFRQKVRNAIRRMTREIKKLKGEAKATKKEELAIYKVKHLIT